MILNNVAQLWFEILFEKLKPGKDEFINFIKTEGNNVDENFTNICGFLIARLDKEDSEKYVDGLKSIKESNETLITTPFNSCMDYRSWKNAVSCLIWIQAIFNCARIYEENTNLKNLSEEIEETWINTNRNKFEVNLEPLIAFASRIKENIKNKYV